MVDDLVPVGSDAAECAVVHLLLLQPAHHADEAAVDASAPHPVGLLTHHVTEERSK